MSKWDANSAITLTTLLLMMSSKGGVTTSGNSHYVFNINPACCIIKFTIAQSSIKKYVELFSTNGELWYIA